jgi:DNA-binding transcriptional regulator YiaG
MARLRRAYNGMTPAALRAIRKRLGLTQTGLARQLGVALRTVQSWEYGERRVSEPVARLLATLGACAQFPPSK